MNQSGCGMTATEVKAQPRVPQVEEQRKALNETASELEKVVDILEERLSAVAFTGMNAEKVPPINVPTPVIVPLAASLEELRRHIGKSVKRLRDLNGAIQL